MDLVVLVCHIHDCRSISFYNFEDQDGVVILEIFQGLFLVNFIYLFFFLTGGFSFFKTQYTSLLISSWLSRSRWSIANSTEAKIYLNGICLGVIEKFISFLRRVISFLFSSLFEIFVTLFLWIFLLCFGFNNFFSLCRCLSFLASLLYSPLWEIV